MSTTSRSLEFYEEQPSPKGMRMVFTVASITSVIAGIVVIVVMHVQGPPMQIWEWFLYSLIIIVLPIAIMLWLWYGRQEVQISREGIRVRQTALPMKPRIISWNQVTGITVRKLNTIGEFGGWGYRYGSRRTWGFIWGGNHCIDIHLVTGKRLVISVIDHEGAREALEMFSSASNP
jgi:hypothetical protein